MAPRSQASTARRCDLVEGEIVGRAAQVLVRAALREGAELAAEVADVGVVDVAVDDVAHDVAADRAAQRVGRARDVRDSRRRGPRTGARSRVGSRRSPDVRALDDRGESRRSTLA